MIKTNYQIFNEKKVEFSEMHQNPEFQIFNKTNLWQLGTRTKGNDKEREREQERERERTINKTVENIDKTNIKVVALLVNQLPQRQIFLLLPKSSC